MVTEQKRRGRKPKMKVELLTEETKTCPECHGLGIQEFHAGLLSRKCRVCNGTGRVPIGG